MSNRSFLLIGTVLAGLLVGCSAEHHYSEGLKAQTRGNYDKAIDNYAKAVAKEPGNVQYRQALDSARRQASANAVDEAVRLAADYDLAGASAVVGRALRYDPTNVDAVALDAELRGQIAAIEQRRRHAIELANQGLFDQAIDEMQHVLSQHRTLPGGQNDLARIRQQAAAHWVGQANVRMSRGELDQAEQAARVALGYWPGDANAQRVLQAVANYRQADRLVRQAHADLAAGRFEQALAALQQANRLHPDRADIPGLMHSARLGIFHGHVAAGQQATAAGNHAEALRQFQLAAAVLPGHENIDELIRVAQAELAGRYRRAADAAFAQQRWGNALINFLLADMTAPRSVPAHMITHSADQVRRRLGYPVAVLAGAERLRAEHRDLADALEGAVRQHLSVVRPEQVTVLSRADTQRALARHKITAARFFGARPAEAITELAESVGGVVVASITHHEFINQQAPTTVSVRVQAGVQRVENPAYSQAAGERDRLAAEAARLTAERDRLLRREANLADDPPSRMRDRNLAEVRRDLQQVRRQLAEAQAAVDAANRALAGIPRQIPQPVFSDIPLPATQHTRTLRLLVDVKVVDAATGTLLGHELLDASMATTGVEHAGSRQHKVPPQPLVLGDDATLVQQATARAVEAVAAAAEAGLFAWPARFDTLAASARAARQPDHAVEALVDRLFAEPWANPATERAFAELLGLVPHDRRLDLRGALLGRAGVLRPPVRVAAQFEQGERVVLLTRLPGVRLPADLAMPATVLAVDGKPVRTVAGLGWILNSVRPGSRIPMDIAHGEQQARVLLAVE